MHGCRPNHRRRRNTTDILISRSKPFILRAALAASAALLGAALIVPDADARRLGGGRSLSRPAADATRQEAQAAEREALPTQPSQAAAPQIPTRQAPAQPTPNHRLGPIGGLAAALGIAALVSHLGLVTPLAELLAGALTIGLPVLAAMILWRMLRGPRAPRHVAPRLEPALNVAQVIGTPSGGRSAGSAADSVTDAGPSSVTGAVPRRLTGADPSSLRGFGGARPAARAAPTAAIAPRPPGVPLDFDVGAFARTAKLQFLRLQAAGDARNLADISQFTTPEILAEIRVQLDEDGGIANRTQVVKVDAELLGIEEGVEDWVARVRFSGTIREHPGESAQPFQEIWNLSKRKKRGAGWLLAGIQHLP
jgi:predicted lipid-binding transport protein (Tim44 family)